jgi:hypothetical protein
MRECALTNALGTVAILNIIKLLEKFTLKYDSYENFG